MAKGSIKIFKNGKYEKYYSDSLYDKIKPSEDSDVTLQQEMTEVQSTVSRLDKSCTVGVYAVQPTDNKTWFKFASLQQNVTNSRHVATFLVTHVMGNQGILKVITKEVPSDIRFEFTMNSGPIDASLFKLGYKIESGKPSVFELYCKISSGWSVTHFKVLHESVQVDNKTDGWVLHNNQNANGLVDLPTNLTYITGKNSTIANTISGGADFANKLKTARNIELVGAVTGSVSFDGSKNVKIQTSLKSCRVGHNTSSEQDKVWFKVASTKMENNHHNGNITLKVTTTNGNSESGILKILCRRGNSASDYLWTHIEWESIVGYDPKNFVLACGNDGTNTYFELWTKIVGSNTRLRFVVLDEGGLMDNYSEQWTLYNLMETSGASTAPTAGYKLVESKIVPSISASKLAEPRNIQLSGFANGEVSFDGSEDVIIETSPLSCVVGVLGGSNTAKPYHLIGEIETGERDQNSKQITFKVTQTYCGTGAEDASSGILLVTTRNHNGSPLSDLRAGSDIKWENCQGIDPNNFYLLMIYRDTKPVYQLYVKENKAYQRYRFTVIDEGASFTPYKNTWKLYNSGDNSGFSELPANEFVIQSRIETIDNNVKTATKLQTGRTINGTTFDGSANITTSKWGTSRQLKIDGSVSGSANVDGSANVTLNVKPRFAMVGAGEDYTPSSDPDQRMWFKFASYATTANYSNAHITFRVTETHGNGSGVLKVHVRRDINKYDIVWLERRGIAVEDFVLAYKLPETGFSLELWAKVKSRYNFFRFNVIDEGNRSESYGKQWTLYNAAGTNNAFKTPTEGFTLKNSINDVAAHTAEKFKITRNINLTGQIEGSITFDGSTDVNVVTKNVMYKHGSQSTNNKPYRRIAEYDFSVSNCSARLSLRINEDVNSEFGSCLLLADIRCSNVNTVIKCNLYLSENFSVNANDFMLTHRVVNGKAKVELWFKSRQIYHTIRVTVLENMSISADAASKQWTILNPSDTGNELEALPTGATTTKAKILVSETKTKDSEQTLKAIRLLCKMVGMDTTDSDTMETIATKLNTFSDANSCLMYIPAEQTFNQTMTLEYQDEE